MSLELRDATGRGPSLPPGPPERGPAALALSLPRIGGDLLLALSYTVHELPHLVQDLRVLVNDLTRLAHAADDGALTDLIRATADLSAAKAAELRAS